MRGLNSRFLCSSSPLAGVHLRHTNTHTDQGNKIQTPQHYKPL